MAKTRPVGSAGATRRRTPMQLQQRSHPARPGPPIDDDGDEKVDDEQALLEEQSEMAERCAAVSNPQRPTRPTTHGVLCRRAYEHIKSGVLREGADCCLACGFICFVSVGFFFLIIYFDLPV